LGFVFWWIAHTMALSAPVVLELPMTKSAPENDGNDENDDDGGDGDGGSVGWWSL
jgi:hypothetical protein